MPVCRHHGTGTECLVTGWDLRVSSTDWLQGPLPLSAGGTECGSALLQNRLGATVKLQRPV